MLSPALEKKPYERPVLTKLGALRDVTLTQWTSRGRRDGWKNRNTGRGGMNGLSRDSNS
ncbi:lasso RiPP family leader peptide-containing protein [Reyranella sp.]|uniref:lasso RiPP family leader peptide-containing protein n=1 Tax=Reyranella sp. TaxID=1929291 RepID=UPI0025F49BAC|nr:lasso RiPP family leader peptide-containing protein [Reyranella sp.]